MDFNLVCGNGSQAFESMSFSEEGLINQDGLSQIQFDLKSSKCSSSPFQPKTDEKKSLYLDSNSDSFSKIGKIDCEDRALLKVEREGKKINYTCSEEKLDSNKCYSKSSKSEDYKCRMVNADSMRNSNGRRIFPYACNPDNGVVRCNAGSYVTGYKTLENSNGEKALQFQCSDGTTKRLGDPNVNDQINKEIFTNSSGFDKVYFNKKWKDYNQDIFQPNVGQDNVALRCGNSTGFKITGFGKYDKALTEDEKTTMKEYPEMHLTQWVPFCSHKTVKTELKCNADDMIKGLNSEGNYFNYNCCPLSTKPKQEKKEIQSEHCTSDEEVQYLENLEKNISNLQKLLNLDVNTNEPQKGLSKMEIYFIAANAILVVIVIILYIVFSVNPKPTQAQGAGPDL